MLEKRLDKVGTVPKNKKKILKLKRGGGGVVYLKGHGVNLNNNF